MNQVTETIQKESLKSKSASLSCLTDSEKLSPLKLQQNPIFTATTTNQTGSFASSLAMDDLVSDNDIKLVIDHVKQTSAGDEQEGALSRRRIP